MSNNTFNQNGDAGDSYVRWPLASCLPDEDGAYPAARICNGGTS